MERKSVNRKLKTQLYCCNMYLYVIVGKFVFSDLNEKEILGVCICLRLHGLLFRYTSSVVYSLFLSVYILLC